MPPRTPEPPARPGPARPGPVRPRLTRRRRRRHLGAMAAGTAGGGAGGGRDRPGAGVRGHLRGFLGHRGASRREGPSPAGLEKGRTGPEPAGSGSGSERTGRRVPESGLGFWRGPENSAEGAEGSWRSSRGSERKLGGSGGTPAPVPTGCGLEVGPDGLLVGEGTSGILGTCQRRERSGRDRA